MLFLRFQFPHVSLQAVSTNFSICIMPPLGMLWHSPFSPALTSSSEIQAISRKDSNSAGPLAPSPCISNLKKTKKQFGVQRDGMPMGSGLKTAGPPTLGSPWREPAGRITHSEAKAASYCRFWSACPNNFVWTRISRDSPPLLILGCLKGRGEEGLSWDSTELGVVGLVTPAADAPTEVPSPEIMLLLVFFEGWTYRKAEHMQERGMKTITWVPGESAPYHSSLRPPHLFWTCQPFPANSASLSTIRSKICLFPPDVCILLPLFKQILCFYYTQMLQSLPLIFVQLHREKTPTPPSRCQWYLPTVIYTEIHLPPRYPDTS